MLLTKKQIAESVKVSVSTIDRYMKKGCPYFKAPKGRVLFSFDKVLEWLTPAEKELGLEDGRKKNV